MSPDEEFSGAAALIQELESLQRAGLTAVPKVAPLPATASAPRPPTARPPAAPPRPASVPPSPVRPPLVSTPAESMPRKAPPAPSAARVETPLEIPPQPLARSQREELLKTLCGRVAACTRCEELAATRTQTVFGVGNPEAKLLFIGEAPGADEDKQGEPFVGKAGQLLNRIIEACRLKREDVYICNVLRCRPPGNRTPSPTEAANCWEWLSSQVAVVDPDYIVCWGSVAAQTLLKTTQAIGKMRGRFLSYNRAKVLCTYHPSYLLRNPAAKKDVWDDMKFLMADMGVTL